MTQEQLRYVFFLLTTFPDPVVVKTYIFLRFTGLEVLKKVSGGVRCALMSDGHRREFNIATWQIQSLLHQFDYIDSYDGMGVRLERIQRYHAVDALLHGLPFVDYLNCEIIYQGFLQTKDEKRMDALARILYRDDDDNAPDLTDAHSYGAHRHVHLVHVGQDGHGQSVPSLLQAFEG